MAIKLLIVDDHPVVRVGLRHMLAETEFTVAGEAADGEQALASLPAVQPDLMVLDVRMPTTDGLRCLAKIKAQRPDLPVVMFSAYENPTFLARAVALHAAGYLLKSIDRDSLVAALQRAARGESLWSRDELRRASGPVNEATVIEELETPLTRRELEVLKQLAFGLTNKEIAEALGISYETVKEHVQHILRKLGVADRTQAAVWAVRSNLA